MGRLANWYWTTMFSRWPAPRGAAPGYTVLLPVPHDLPVFLSLALESTRRQAAENRAAVLVIPDRPTARFRAAFAASEAAREVNAELVEMGWRGRLARRIGNRKELFLQIVAGVKAATTEHVLIHDADAFALTPNFFEDHYRQCVDRRLEVIGVDPVWDDWFRERGRDDIVATWEMLATTSWLRRFPPQLHRGHVAELDGRSHSFDITLLPQARSDIGEIGLHEGRPSFVHFNHVIRTYRLYRKARELGRAFDDVNYRLLLIRLLIELFGDDDPASHGEVPTLEAMRVAVQESVSESGETAIRYDGISTPDGAERWYDFHKKLRKLLASDFVDDDQSDHANRAIAPFLTAVRDREMAESPLSQQS